MQRANNGVLVVAAVAAMCAGACGGAGGSSPSPTTAAQRGGTGAPRAGCGAQAAVVALGSASGSSTIALARAHGRRVAFVADEDAKAVLTVDLDTRAQLAETPLGGRPGQLLVTPDGRVLVTMRDGGKLLSLEVSGADRSLVTRCEATTPAEPIAIATTPDGATILVTSGWGSALAAFDASTLAPRWTAAVPREPRAVVVSDDGKTAFVSHAVGSFVSAVDLGAPSHRATAITLRGMTAMELRQQQERAELSAKGAAVVAAEAREPGRPSCQGFTLAKANVVPGRIFAPEVFVDPGDLEERPDGYGNQNADTEVAGIAVLDEGARAPLRPSTVISAHLSAKQRKLMMGDPRSPRPECLLPRASVVDESTKSLLVTCFGIDAVVAYDAENPSPLRAERRRWTVGSGPSGIAVDAEKHRAVVWSQFDRTVTTFPIGGTQLVDERTTPSVVARTAMPPLREKIPAEYALGRILFHAAGDMRLSGDGRACASCHPDGRDDGITWATPEGPRRSMMLAGRVSTTPPYSWNGNEHTIANHLSNTFDRLSGNGLHGIELDALVTFISQMPAPPERKLDAAERAKAERGKQIFASAEAGCASCHSGPNLTDGRNHEVGSRHKADRGTAFNTPSLRFVSGTGPYFHDGRYGTLRELLEKSDGSMGKTGHLSATDRDALESFLRTL